MNYPISRFVREIPDELLDSSVKVSRTTIDSIPSTDNTVKARPLYGGFLQNKNSVINKGVVKNNTSDPGSIGASNKPYASTDMVKKRPVAKAVPKVDLSGSAGITKGSSFGNSINYKVGDRVSHIKFGEGIVKDIDSSGNNTYVTIHFDQYGQRVLDSRFAKLKVL